MQLEANVVQIADRRQKESEFSYSNNDDQDRPL